MPQRARAVGKQPRTVVVFFPGAPLLQQNKKKNKSDKNQASSAFKRKKKKKTKIKTRSSKKWQQRHNSLGPSSTRALASASAEPCAPSSGDDSTATLSRHAERNPDLFIPDLGVATTNSGSTDTSHAEVDTGQKEFELFLQRRQKQLASKPRAHSLQQVPEKREPPTFPKLNRQPKPKRASAPSPAEQAAEIAEIRRSFEDARRVCDDVS